MAGGRHGGWAPTAPRHRHPITCASKGSNDGSHAMKLQPAPDGNGAFFSVPMPGAANVLHLRGGLATRFAHIALHRTDLTFANECVRLVSELQDRNTVTAEALWRCALLHYSKCFAPPKVAAGRSHLDARRVLNNEPGAMADHAMFLEIRNKQLAHDEGTHNFWSVGAVIAPVGAPRKVDRIAALQLEGVTSGAENPAKLQALILRCAAWAEAEFNDLMVKMMSLLERVPHEDLLRHREAEMKLPAGKPRRSR